MTDNSDVARTGRPKYEDESGGRTKTIMVWVTEAEKGAIEEAADIDAERAGLEKTNLSDWLRDLARVRAKRLGVRLPKQR